MMMSLWLWSSRLSFVQKSILLNLHSTAHLLQGSSKWRRLSHHYWCIAESGWKACFCWVSDFPYWFIWTFAVLFYSFSLVLGVNFMFANLGIYWRCRTDILILFLNQDPNPVRAFIVQQEGNSLLGLLVRKLHSPSLNYFATSKIRKS